MSSQTATERTTSAITSTDLLSFVGNTPLLKLGRIAAEYHPIEIFAKAEWFNPGGSVKDRPALNMILDGERSGKLDQMLGNAAKAFEERTEQSVKLFTTALPPILVVGLACVVGFVVMAILLALLQVQDAAMMSR